MVVHGPFPVGEPRVVREAQAALDAGFEVDVLCMRRGNEVRTENLDGVRVTRLPVRHRRGAPPLTLVAEYLGFTALATVWLGAKFFRRRYEVVHVHNPPDFLIVTALLPKLFGASVIFDIHDPSPEMMAMRFGRVGDSGLIQRTLAVIERIAAGLSNSVITVHEPYRRELINRHIRPDKVSVVMNSVDERLIPLRDHLYGEDLRLFYHGTVTPPYGVELIIDAAAQLTDEFPTLSVEICGEGDSVERVLQRADQTGLRERVMVSGEYLPHREVLARARDASIGVIPNLPTKLNNFALSSKLFEYVVLGVPVVVAELPTIREYFGPDEVTFFRAGDPSALAQAIRTVTCDKELARAKTVRAQLRYRAYSWPANAARYVQILENLAGDAVGDRPTGYSGPLAGDRPASDLARR